MNLEKLTDACRGSKPHPMLERACVKSTRARLFCNFYDQGKKRSLMLQTLTSNLNLKFVVNDDDVASQVSHGWAISRWFI